MPAVSAWHLTATPMMLDPNQLRIPLLLFARFLPLLSPSHLPRTFFFPNYCPADRIRAINLSALRRSRIDETSISIFHLNRSSFSAGALLSQNAEWVVMCRRGVVWIKWKRRWQRTQSAQPVARVGKTKRSWSWREKSVLYLFPIEITFFPVNPVGGSSFQRVSFRAV